MDGHGALTTLPLELIDHILSFLPWPFDLHSLLLVNQRLSPIAERALYRNLDELPPQRSVRLLLSLVNAPAARREFVKALKVNFTENMMLFALERLIAKVLGLLPRLRTLIVEVSNENCALARIFPLDAPFRLRSFDTSIRYAWLFCSPLFLRERTLKVLLSDLIRTWQRFSNHNPRYASSRYAACPYLPRAPSHSSLPHCRTSRPFARCTWAQTPSARSISASFFPPPRLIFVPAAGDRDAPRAGYLAHPLLGARISRARGACAHVNARSAPHDPHRRWFCARRALPGALRAPSASRGAAHRGTRATLQPRTFLPIFPLSSPPVESHVGDFTRVIPTAGSVRWPPVSDVHGDWLGIL